MLHVRSRMLTVHFRCEIHGERPEMVHAGAICNLCVREAMEIDTRRPNWWKRPEDGGPPSD